MDPAAFKKAGETLNFAKLTALPEGRGIVEYGGSEGKARTAACIKQNPKSFWKIDFRAAGVKIALYVMTMQVLFLAIVRFSMAAFFVGLR